MLPRDPVVPALQAAILAWFDDEQRSFPFRGIRDPYGVLVSEAMAQQTQVSRAAEAWSRWMARFPTVAALATAAPADVLREWRGLGYNRRAVSLHRAARIIVDEHGGEVPDEVATLERLPGVGPYTARAVAAIAFNRPVGAVDTNVRRVLGRIVPGAAAMSPRALQAVADAVVPHDRPADWTGAVMDLGARVCTPRVPDCGACPAMRWCAHARDRRDGAPAARAGAPRRPAAGPFRATTRWLRGRILDRLRDAPGVAWVSFGEPIGEHDARAVAAAIARLAGEGLAEVHAEDPARARLPLG